MANTYRTKAGETLDWICWQYYLKEITLGGIAMAVDPRLLDNPSLLDNGFLLNNDSDESIRGTVEMVLQANPGLASYPLALPAGLDIYLPDPATAGADVSNTTVNIWD